MLVIQCVQIHVIEEQVMHLVQRMPKNEFMCGSNPGSIGCYRTPQPPLSCVVLLL